jgi:hypothetical protein
VSQLNYLGITVTNQNLIQEEIKRRTNSGNACYHSFLSSCLLSKIKKMRIYKTIILSVVLYGNETWSLALREAHRLRVFENRVLRRLFGPKRDEVTGEWRELHNEELCNLYSLPSIIRIINSRRMRWAGHVARIGKKWNACRLLVGKAEGKRQPGRLKRRWVDNIRMDVEQVGWGNVNWIDLAQDRNRWRALVNSVLSFRIPQNAGKLLGGLTAGGHSSIAQLHRGSQLVNNYIHCRPMNTIMAK